MAANMAKAQRWRGIAFCLCYYFLHCSMNISAKRWIQDSDKASSSPLKLITDRRYVHMDNGIVKLKLTNPAGLITKVSYQEIDNVLESHEKQTDRGYWDMIWSPSMGRKGVFDKVESTSFRVIAETKDQIEVSFKKTWNFSHGSNFAPLNVDKRFVMLRGVSGFYTYAIFEHLEGWPELYIDAARITLKLDQKTFRYMAIADKKQRIMPTDRDRESGRMLDFSEAVLLTRPGNPTLKGEVDDKYQYSVETQYSHVHGWVRARPHVGFWMIRPSDEFVAGGPMRPLLTSHCGSTSLSVFISSHYMGPKFGVKVHRGEPWKKVFGPVFVYLNSDSSNNTRMLWEEAKKQMWQETKKWPYDFPLSNDFPRAKQRGAILGRLLVHDRHMYRHNVAAKWAYVGLALPGNDGSWQDDAKGYQFWTRSNEKGYFEIRNVREGIYNLYAWVPGILGDYKHHVDVVIRQGRQIKMGTLVYDPPRNGPTLWEIGIPDRTAFEYYIPGPIPGLTNKLYINHNEKYRQYGLWDRYTDLYPTRDLTYTVGVSDYRKDWFFAHVNRKVNNSTYIPTTWQISFDIRNVTRTGHYTLRLALASANLAEIQVRINNPNAMWPHFTTGLIGRDNAIARHGIHGRHRLYGIDISGFHFVNGKNNIFLKQARGFNPFRGVMYDYIRLEGPL